MSKNIFHVAKRSEYRNNYLPFDYYDFMITAKENENLRFRNKIRDYLHTPFDWVSIFKFTYPRKIVPGKKNMNFSSSIFCKIKFYSF
jgi:hypothetical protein